MPAGKIPHVFTALPTVRVVRPIRTVRTAVPRPAVFIISLAARSAASPGVFLAQHLQAQAQGPAGAQGTLTTCWEYPCSPGPAAHFRVRGRPAAGSPPAPPSRPAGTAPPPPPVRFGGPPAPPSRPAGASPPPPPVRTAGGPPPPPSRPGAPTPASPGFSSPPAPAPAPAPVSRPPPPSGAGRGPPPPSSAGATGGARKRPIKRSEISGPVSGTFQHLSHLGLSVDGSFKIENLPDEWRAVFIKAGVSEEEMKDSGTAEFIMKFLRDSGLPDARGAPAGGAATSSMAAPPMAAPPLPGRGPPPPPPAGRPAPPPPPPSGGGGFAAPPPPPPPAGGFGGPPPPPPPSGGFGAPPPPASGGFGAPPPPSRGPAPPSGGGLLEAIRGHGGVQKLSAASERQIEPSAASPGGSGGDATDSIASALRQALNARSDAFRGNSSDESESDNDDWD
ncbi:hypothetical protein H696_04421 [Fonticula alba]|uniref:CRIB domain-containing protein n=1 Tax=Fonticula alba TaxID=691883 RepID=A0A058Z4H4_FONAL|nr:hypothetical protein H696_04421 [Fonticula alba]KCV69001.1 hypothetical protein H696_04421 [Fonticula alba]|eukprot:XP_009496572.1 hypothetical protein H696_04421 [Fonticula alba]